MTLFTEMNDKAMESMNADEPETSLEYLKKVESYLSNLEKNNEVFENQYAMINKSKKNSSELD